MPVEINHRPLPSISFVANNTSGQSFLDIPRDRNIRRIIMRFVLNITTTGVAPTYTEDDILNVVKKARLVMNGNDNKFNTPARIWFYRETFERHTLPYKVNPTSSVSTTADSEFVLIADFAQEILNDHDISALLPARRLASLRLEIDWGDNTLLATANAPTINAVSRCVVEIVEATGETDVLDQATNKVMTKNLDDLDYLDIREGFLTVAIDANHSSFDNDTLKQNVIPAPANIMTQLLMIRDQTAPLGNKSNALVTDFKIQKEVGRPRNIIQRTYFSYRNGLKGEYEQEALPTGIVYLDFLDLLGGGLLNSGNEGDVKYRFLTASFSAGQNIDIWTRYYVVPFLKLS